MGLIVQTAAGHGKGRQQTAMGFWVFMTQNVIDARDILPGIFAHIG
jgi:hypothetical protein